MEIAAIPGRSIKCLQLVNMALPPFAHFGTFYHSMAKKAIVKITNRRPGRDGDLYRFGVKNR